ncbi:MAG: 5'-methylthioadenosine/adenosylhomocysteine nucleosidase [Cytophagaceae bacterium]|nr:5'-methylthioadenosine/adenosylhomocysteine nucleosidase [Cytophagaceae bacterium]
MSQLTGITGIIAPMHEEIELILEHTEVHSIVKSGQREYHCGRIHNKEVVVALSRIGKVASGVTAAVMIEKFGISQLIVTGVAGAISESLRIGDLVVATECVQHDLDARPMFSQFEAPLLGKAFFECHEPLQRKAMECCQALLENNFNGLIHPDDIEKFQLNQAKLHQGQICCGDQFIGTDEQLQRIRADLREVLAVEMEGGAVGQVCFEYDVPYVVMRSISDTANHQATVDFNAYIKRVARHYTWGLIDQLLR